MRAARGFSLIELIMIIVAISVMGVFLTTTFSQLPRPLEVSEGAQTASQLAQQCSERVLARRRASGAGLGFASIVTGTCAGLPTLPGYTVTDVVAPLAGGACPALAACKQVTVTVTRNAATVAETVFLLVNI
ncbi:MAG TPA: type II secretion system protein [Acidiferrobacterales bacterium]|nr:type II secretion system protein [Acidiferrobacterales bacterium]